MKRRLLVSLLTLLALVLLAELGLRLLEPRLGVDEEIRDLRAYLVDGVLLAFEPRPHTVFQRPPGRPSINSDGFSDREWSRRKAPGVPRLLCLGGSTTESGNPAGLEGSYPYLLERTLEARTGRDFEVLNAGISGWSSAEILVSWFLTLQDLEPDLVLFHEAINDVEPRFSADFRPDYSHWRRPVPGSSAAWWERFLASWSDVYLYLRLERGAIPNITRLTSSPQPRKDPLLAEGRIAEATALPFRRNVWSIASSARSRGARVALVTLPTRPDPERLGDRLWGHGVAQHNQHLRGLAAEHDLLLVDAARGFEDRGGLGAEFSDPVHLSPRGNQVKAELIAEVLLERWIPGLATETGR